MKNTISVLGLFALSMLGFTNKADNAVDVIKTYFPQLKNTTTSIEPSRFGEFGILLKDETGKNPVSAYLMGKDINGDKNLQTDEVNSVYIAYLDARETHERGIIASLKENASDYKLGVNEANAPDFPLQKFVDAAGPRTKFQKHGFGILKTAPIKSFNESIKQLALVAYPALEVEKKNLQAQIDKLTIN